MGVRLLLWSSTMSLAYLPLTSLRWAGPKLLTQLPSLQPWAAVLCASQLRASSTFTSSPRALRRRSLCLQSLKAMLRRRRSASATALAKPSLRQLAVLH